MNPTVDFVYLVVARFDGRLEFWRQEAFTTYTEAAEAWDAHVKMAGHEVRMELVRIVRVNLDMSGGVSVEYSDANDIGD